MHTIITTILNCLLIICFSGCSKFLPKRIIKQKEVSIEAQAINKEAFVHAKLLSQTERVNHFNHFKVIQCTVKNKTNQPLTIDQTSINIPLARAEDVQKKEPKIYTAYFIPALFSTISAYFFWYQLALPLAVGCSLIGAHASGKTNTSNINHLKKIALFAGQSVTIQPKQSKTFLFFIPKQSYQPKFKLTIHLPNSTTTELDLSMHGTTAPIFKMQG